MTFHELHDPDPPVPTARTLANVAERARVIRRRRRAATLASGVIVAAVVIGVSTAQSGGGDEVRSIVPAETAEVETTATENTMPEATSTATSLTAAIEPSTTSAFVTVPPGPTSTSPLTPERIPIYALGDNVMLGAAGQLNEAGIFVDAMVSRAFVEGLDQVVQLHAKGRLGDAVIVHLGTNGTIAQADMDRMMAELSEVATVVLVTNRIDRSWTGSNNLIITDAVARNPNARLIDWKVLGDNCPGNCFYADDIHLRPDGQRYYADLLIEAVTSATTAHPPAWLAVSFENFAEDLARSKMAVGGVSVGDPCDAANPSWLEDRSHLQPTLVPVADESVNGCIVGGWAYRGLAPADLPYERPSSDTGQAVLNEDGSLREWR